jgi:hypothetical protein
MLVSTPGSIVNLSDASSTGTIQHRRLAVLHLTRITS